MADENSGTDGQDSGGAEGGGGQAPPDVQSQINALKAQYDRQIADLRKENGDHRTKKNQAQAELDEYRKTQGEFEPLWRQELDAKAALEAKLAELEQPAKLWKEFETSAKSALEARIAKLPADDQEIVRSISDVNKALAAVARFEAKGTPPVDPQKKKPPGSPPPVLGAPPTGTGTVDFFGARSKEELRELMDKHPDEFAKLESSYAPKPKSFLAGLWSKK